MVDIALTENLVAQDRAVATRRFSTGDARFRRFTLAAALGVLAVFIGVMISLIAGAWPAIKHFGLPFVWTDAWNPVTEKFGALAPIYGTLVTSLLAMLMAVPVGIGTAIFLTEIVPAPAAPAHRHRHRAAGRHPQHHLRHLGPVRVRAGVPVDGCSPS